MYLEHYNLRQIPFRNTPDPAFYFETPRHKEALANLIYAVEQRRGFVLLSGEIGSGKTLVTHMLVRHVEEHAQLAMIRNTHLSSAQLIRLVCDEFSIQVSDHSTGNDKASMLMAFNQFLIQQLAQDRLVVIIIDEAQNLSDKVLEELRMLSNLETSSEKLVQIVLVGQPELRDKVSQPHLEQLRQRVALTYHLDPLTPEEVAGYIEHRLTVAAGGEAHKVVFTPAAIAKIARFSRGTPRIINGLCDNALLYGFSAQTTTIDDVLIDKVIKHSMHLAPRSHVPPRSPVETSPAVSPQPRPPRPATPVVSTTPQAPVPMPMSEEAAAPGALQKEPAADSPALFEEDDKKSAASPSQHSISDASAAECDGPFPLIPPATEPASDAPAKDRPSAIVRLARLFNRPL